MSLYVRKGGARRGIRAVGLVSGGLDSTLAAEMLKREGVDVVGLHFATGFCKTAHRRSVGRSRDKRRDLGHEALRAAEAAKFPIEVVDVTDEYLREVVLSPRHGYGAHVNPCIDCRIFMLRKARDYADACGAEVVFTGEVIGQRPFSQHRKAMELVEKEADLEGRLLRPLSARHMTPTRAEVEGRLDRSRLGRIGGRSRREQRALAAEYGVERYPQPSGGCCALADEAFARRLRDFLTHHGKAALTADVLPLLKTGRQFRLSPATKLHVGHEHAENQYLERLAPGRVRLKPLQVPGPTGLLYGAPSEEDLSLAAAVIARYADLEGVEACDVEVMFEPRLCAGAAGEGVRPARTSGGWVRSIRARPADSSHLEKLRI